MGCREKGNHQGCLGRGISRRPFTRGIALGFLRMGYHMKDQWEAFLKNRSPDVEQMAAAMKKYEERGVGEQPSRKR